MKHLNRLVPVTAALGACSFLVACGGGSSSSSTATQTIQAAPGNPTWIAGQFDPEQNFAARCATPRIGIDPFSGQAFPDQPGSELEEKLWLRSWSNDSYLWFDEIDDNDPNDFSVPAYFAQLKTNELTPSGTPKDNFHFSQSTEEYNTLTQTGVASGYGFDWEFVSTAPPRELVVRFTEPNSPAAVAGIPRGAKLLSVNGIDFVNDGTQAGVDLLNAALFPEQNGQSTSFEFSIVDGSEISVEIVSANIEVSPVQNVRVLETDSGLVGYMQFNSFIQTAQPDLIDAFQTFIDENITELVLDLRYNGGGLLALSSQLAYMVAGPQTDGLIFETLQFNDKHPNTNPVTGNAIQPTPFYALEIDYNQGVFTNTALPSPSLTRVYVLTTANTCSASESLINSLRGINVEVIQIGDTTCGKPYGFYPTDNCGTTYFTIQFQGVNEQGFGDYADGFVPTQTPTFDFEVPGCVVPDDFSQALGDVNEGLLAAALEHRRSGQCPPEVAQKTLKQIESEGLEIKQPNQNLRTILQQNKILQPIIEQQ